VGDVVAKHGSFYSLYRSAAFAIAPQP